MYPFLQTLTVSLKKWMCHLSKDQRLAFLQQTPWEDPTKKKLTSKGDANVLRFYIYLGCQTCGNIWNGKKKHAFHALWKKIVHETWRHDKHSTLQVSRNDRNQSKRTPSSQLSIVKTGPNKNVTSHFWLTSFFTFFSETFCRGAETILCTSKEMPNSG